MRTLAKMQGFDWRQMGIQTCPEVNAGLWKRGPGHLGSLYLDSIIP
jgi:hypothetical protein